MRSNACFSDRHFQIIFGNLLHFHKNHWGDFLRVERLSLSQVLHSDERFIIGTFFQLEWPVLLIFLDAFIREISSNQSFGIKYCIFGVHHLFVLSCKSDFALILSEWNYRGGCCLSKFIWYDLDLPVYKHPNAWMCGAQIDSDCWRLRSAFHNVIYIYLNKFWLIFFISLY